MEKTDNIGNLTVRQITQRYGRRKVLRDISFTAEPGSCVGIIGINGGGKSTLLSILAGVRYPRSGSISFQGRNMLKKSASRQLAGYLPQGDPLMEELTVYDNLKLWYGGKVREDLPVLQELCEIFTDRVVKELPDAHQVSHVEQFGNDGHPAQGIPSEGKSPFDA